MKIVLNYLFYLKKNIKKDKPAKSSKKARWMTN